MGSHPRPDAEAATVLGLGRFFGRAHHQAAADGFTIADMSADPRLDVPRHTHEGAHLIVLLRGAYVTTARGAPALCTEPIVIFNPPGTTHRDRFVQIRGRYEGRFLSIGIEPSRMAALREDAGFDDEPRCLQGLAVVETAARLAAECGEWNDSSPPVAEGLCLALAARAAATPDRAGSSPPRWLRTALECLHDDWMGVRTIRQVADAAGVHPVHLARVFQRFVGCTPGEYARRLRLERAEALLATTRAPLGEIASAVGFSDQSHFTKAFRRAHGVPPARHRRLNARS